MMPALFGDASAVGWVALKALLLIAIVLVAFRLGGRRTFAQLSPFDFAISVALGAIIGRTATSGTTSFLTGVVALVTLLLIHGLITGLRRRFGSLHIFDQPPNVLVLDGAMQPAGLKRSGLTDGDVAALLRQQSIGDLAEVEVMLYENSGAVSLLQRGAQRGPLMDDALQAAGYPRGAGATSGGSESTSRPSS